MVDLGKIGIRNRGDHVAGNQYEKNDIVKKDGIAFFCLKDTSDAPTTENTEYWQVWSREAVEMHGATSSEDGTGGLVPKPMKGDEKKALLGDGTWGDVAIDVDDVLSDTSENPVQNKVVTNELSNINGNIENITKNKTLYVDGTNGSDDNSGSQDSPFKTIQKAINSCNKNGFNVIHIADGTYTENIGIWGFIKRIILHADGRDCNIVGRIAGNDNKSVILQCFNSITCDSSTTDAVIKFDSSYVQIQSYDSEHPTNIVGDTSIYQYMQCIVAVRSAIIDLGVDSSSSTSYIKISGGYRAIRVSESVVNIGYNVVIDDTNRIGIVISNGNVNASNHYQNNAYHIKVDNANINVSGSGWELIGSATGTTSISVDATEYKEFLVRANNTNGHIPVFIPSKCLSDREELFRGGYCESTSLNGNACIKASKTSIYTLRIIRDNSDVTSSSSITVYGKR